MDERQSNSHPTHSRRWDLLWWGGMCLFFGIAGRILLPPLLPLLAGFAIAFFLKPCTNWVCTHMHMRRRPAAVFAAVLFYLAVGTLLTVLFLMLAGQVELLLRRLPAYWQQNLLPLLRQWNTHLAGLLSPLSQQMGSSFSALLDSVSAALPEAVSALTAALLGWSGRLLQCIPRYGISIGVTILSSIYFCADYRLVVDFLFRQLPPAARPRLLAVKDFLTGCLLRMGRAYLLLFLMTFCELTAGLWLLGVDTFLVAALITACLDILPVIGSGIILVPWGLLSLFQGQRALGIGLLLLYGVITLVRNLVEPKVLGDSVGLHPLLTLSAVFLGGKLLGPLGILLGPLLVLLLKHLNQTGVLHLYR